MGNFLCVIDRNHPKMGIKFGLFSHNDPIFPYSLPVISQGLKLDE